MSLKTCLTSVGVVAVLAGGAATVASSASGDQRSVAQASPGAALGANSSLGATTRLSNRREHRSECVQERGRNRSGFKRDHGTIERCVAQEHRADAREQLDDD